MAKRPVKRKKLKRMRSAKIRQKFLFGKKRAPSAKKSKKSAAKKILMKKARRKIAKHPKLKKTASQKPQSQNMGFSAKDFFKAKIKVIGIGGGGGSIVSDIGRSLHKASFVVADTDARAFKKRAGIKYFLFGQEKTHGLGTGLNTVLARQAAQQQKDQIARLFENQDIVILIACLGGGLGSGATQVFAEQAKNFNGITFGIFTLPFKFEGAHKYKIASKALKELREMLNVSITIPNERIFQVIDETTAITDAFSMVNRMLVESLESLIDLIYSPGIINIDFADVRTILKGKGNLAFLNTAEALGQDRAEKIIANILHNPLYQSHNFVADKILFNIAGSGNVSMIEVDKISRAISQKNPQAKIIFGISKEPGYKNKIKTSLLMTGAPARVQGQGGLAILPGYSEKIKGIQGPPKLKSAKRGKQKKSKNQGSQTQKPEKQTTPDLSVQIPPVPVFGENPILQREMSEGFRRLNITDTAPGQKKSIRRNALEIKKAQDLEEKKKTQQEKEWEIPAFLRKIKIK